MIKIANLSRLNNQRGAVGLEFTIIFPLLLMVTFGIVEFGALMFDKATLTDAVRQGARAAIVFDYDGTDPACSDLTTIQNKVDTVVKQRMGNFGDGNYWLINFDVEPVNPTNVSVETVNSAVGTGNFEYVLAVTVGYRFHFIFIDTIINVLFNGALEDGIRLDTEVKMRGEDQSLLGFLASCP